MTVELPIELPAGRGSLHEVYDYNEGSNAVEVRLGDTTQVMTWEPSGTVGFRWISAVFDLMRPRKSSP